MTLQAVRTRKDISVMGQPTVDVVLKSLNASIYNYKEQSNIYPLQQSKKYLQKTLVSATTTTSTSSLKSTMISSKQQSSTNNSTLTSTSTSCCVAAHARMPVKVAHRPTNHLVNQLLAHKEGSLKDLYQLDLTSYRRVPANPRSTKEINSKDLLKNHLTSNIFRSTKNIQNSESLFFKNSYSRQNEDSNRGKPRGADFYSSSQTDINKSVSQSSKTNVSSSLHTSVPVTKICLTRTKSQDVVADRASTSSRNNSSRNNIKERKIRRKEEEVVIQQSQPKQLLVIEKRRPNSLPSHLCNVSTEEPAKQLSRDIDEKQKHQRELADHQTTAQNYSINYGIQHPQKQFNQLNFYLRRSTAATAQCPPQIYSSVEVVSEEGAVMKCQAQNMSKLPLRLREEETIINEIKTRHQKSESLDCQAKSPRRIPAANKSQQQFSRVNISIDVTQPPPEKLKETRQISDSAKKVAYDVAMMSLDMSRLSKKLPNSFAQTATIALHSHIQLKNKSKAHQEFLDSFSFAPSNRTFLL